MPDRQTRRRGQELEQAILDAAWKELSDKGWAGFTMDRVAARCGTAKTVVYRRWRNRVHLAQDMLQRAADVERAPFRFSGDLRSDLLAFLTGLSDFLRSPFGDAVRGVAFEGDVTVQRSIFGGTALVTIVSDIIEQASVRGELVQAPSPLVLNLGHSVVMFDFFQTGVAPTEQNLADLVDQLWIPALR